MCGEESGFSQALSVQEALTWIGCILMFEVRQKGAALTFIVLSSANTALSANKLAHRRSERVTYPELYTWVGDEGGRFTSTLNRALAWNEATSFSHLLISIPCVPNLLCSIHRY